MACLGTKYDAQSFGDLVLLYVIPDHGARLRVSNLSGQSLDACGKYYSRLIEKEGSSVYGHRLSFYMHISSWTLFSVLLWVWRPHKDVRLHARNCQGTTLRRHEAEVKNLYFVLQGDIRHPPPSSQFVSVSKSSSVVLKSVRKG